jgi:hypothetical protein
MMANVTTVDMGNGVLQRSINLMAASGTILPIEFSGLALDVNYSSHHWRLAI